MKQRLLLLSNSTLPGEPFLEWPEPYIQAFLGKENLNILFFPFAGVRFGFDEYFEKVSGRLEPMGYNTQSAHLTQNKEQAIKNCDVIAVGGGNTFQLIAYLQDGWMELIQKKVTNGAPYIGWSAGSNVACPTIKTTNDMPIVEPKSFNALNLVPFQINPHFTDATIPNHGGETRSQRIEEFLEVNPNMKVYGVPEGSLIQVEGQEVFFKGKGELKIFEKGNTSTVKTSDTRLE